MMPAYNAEKFVGQAIESLRAQTRADWELLVVDDGSTDATGDVARSLGDSRVRVIRQANGGEAAARNTALAHASGTFLAFLDADDLYLPDHLEATVGHLEAHPQLGGVFTDGYYVDDGLRRLVPLSARRRPPRTGRVLEEVVLGSDYFGPPLCVVVRLDAVRRDRLAFDEALLIGTDWDFFRQCAERADFGYVDRVTCLYRLHGANMTTQYGSDRRRLGFARCRMNAIRQPSFDACSLGVRSAVFYDLLVNLLRPEPDRQREVVAWEQFAALPARERARILRLMASKAILHGGSPGAISRWLTLSRRQRVFDLRAESLSLAYRLSPALCRRILGVRTRNEPDPLSLVPFADAYPQSAALRSVQPRAEQ